jgi:hypothetical protein
MLGNSNFDIELYIMVAYSLVPCNLLRLCPTNRSQYELTHNFLRVVGARIIPKLLLLPTLMGEGVSLVTKYLTPEILKPGYQVGDPYELPGIDFEELD